MNLHLISFPAGDPQVRLSRERFFPSSTPIPGIRHLEGTTDPRPRVGNVNQTEAERHNPRIHRLGDEQYVNDTRNGALDTISLAGVKRARERENLSHVDQQHLEVGEWKPSRGAMKQKYDRIATPRNEKVIFEFVFDFRSTFLARRV